MFQKIVRERQILGASVGGLSQQKGDKEQQERGDMASVGCSNVGDSQFNLYKLCTRLKCKTIISDFVCEVETSQTTLLKRV